MSGTVSATFWVQIDPTWSRWYPDTLHHIAAHKVTQRKPRNPEPGTVLVRLTVALPRDAFVPPVFEGGITVEPSSYEQVPAVVSAETLDEP